MVENILDWSYYSIIVIILLAFGYYGIKRATIPFRLAIDAVIGWYFIRLIDLCVRTVLTFNDAYPDATATIHNIVTRQALDYQMGQIVMRIVYISIVAFVLYVVFSLLAKKTQGRFIDESDVLVLTFGILIAGWPNFLIYLFLIFFITAIFSSLMLMFRKKTVPQRIPITPFFALAGIIILFWGTWLSQLTGLYVLR